ncbi:MAG: metallophosphoesterase [Bacteroidota bacterium]|nr:metallophosphoesterase [Bacteroidota bacterium]
MSSLRSPDWFGVYLLLLLTVTARSQSPFAPSTADIDFVSDTQQPMTIEKIKLRSNHNIKATALLFAEILRTRPSALFMLGDVTAVGSETSKWRKVDRFLDSCRQYGIAVHGQLGNHDVMWTRRMGERNFKKRFPDFVDTGFLTVVDSVAVVLLKSNFKKLSGAEIAREMHWYKAALDSLNTDPAILDIIVCCHHAPYSNSLIVGCSKQVQQYFTPAFLQTAKCRLFMTGHAHSFEHFNFGEKDFVVIGGGGGLHQPLDTSSKCIPDLAAAYKPMFHYLSIRRSGEALILTSHFEKPDFSGFSEGYSFTIKPK